MNTFWAIWIGVCGFGLGVSSVFIVAAIVAWRQLKAQRERMAQERMDHAAFSCPRTRAHRPGRWQP